MQGLPPRARRERRLKAPELAEGGEQAARAQVRWRQGKVFSQVFFSKNLRGVERSSRALRGVRGALGARWARSGPVSLPLRSVLGVCHWQTAPEPAGETKSFCLCHKTCENTGFSPVFFLHVLCENGIHSGSDCWFLYLVLSVSNRSHPLQHPKRTRFSPFSDDFGCVSLFLSSFDPQIFRLFFMYPAL